MCFGREVVSCAGSQWRIIQVFPICDLEYLLMKNDEILDFIF
jgi:hypothetical protein